MIEIIKKVIIRVNDSLIIFLKSRDEVVRFLLVVIFESPCTVP